MFLLFGRCTRYRLTAKSRLILLDLGAVVPSTMISGLIWLVIVVQPLRRSILL